MPTNWHYDDDDDKHRYFHIFFIRQNWSGKRYWRDIVRYSECRKRVYEYVGVGADLYQYNCCKSINTDIHFNLVSFIQLCTGGSVTDLVQGLRNRGSRLTEPQITYILKETVQALIYLHENHCMHRDVKGIVLIGAAQ